MLILNIKYNILLKILTVIKFTDFIYIIAK